MTNSKPQVIIDLQEYQDLLGKNKDGLTDWDYKIAMGELLYIALETPEIFEEDNINKKGVDTGKYIVTWVDFKPNNTTPELIITIKKK